MSILGGSMVGSYYKGSFFIIKGEKNIDKKSRLFTAFIYTQKIDGKIISSSWVECLCIAKCLLLRYTGTFTLVKVYFTAS